MPNNAARPDTPPPTAPTSPTSPTDTECFVDCEKGNADEKDVDGNEQSQVTQPRQFTI